MMNDWNGTDVNPESEPLEESQDAEPVQLATGVPTSVVHAPSGSGLNPALTLERFVVGESNRRAYRAAMATIDRTAGAASPLIIYGGVGLGKTHLLHAIGNRFRNNHMDKTVFCVSSERFINQWAQAIAHPKKYSALQRRYYNIDLLLIDDLHFLSEEQSVQEEFAVLLNHLKCQNHRIVCTCDRPPGFLESYLVDSIGINNNPFVEVRSPEFKLRVSILEQKLQERHWGPVPAKVVRYIAKNLTQQVRQLEGCLNRLMAEARLGSDLDLEVVTRVLSDGLSETDTPSNLSLEMIQEEVARYFQIGISDLCSRRRGKRYALPRQVAMYLSRQLTTLSLKQISQGFGYSHHTTVVQSVQRVESLLRDDLVLGQSIDSLKGQLADRGAD